MKITKRPNPPSEEEARKAVVAIRLATFVRGGRHAVDWAVGLRPTGPDRSGERVQSPSAAQADSTETRWEQFLRALARALGAWAV